MSAGRIYRLEKERPRMKQRAFRETTRAIHDQETFFEALVREVQEASIETKRDQVPPVTLLWPDKDRQWELLLPRLRESLPLFTLGTYHPQERAGPAYWLRCVIAGTLPEYALPPGQVPILYLPGLRSHEIQAIAALPRLLQPLAELQYRGILWRQKRNGRDWTIHSFLQSKLNIQVAAPIETKAALRDALPWLVDEPLARLRQESPLHVPFFD